MAKPDWTRDELILALDLYFRKPAARGNKRHPANSELSEVLNRLPIHAANQREAGFRNSNGVSMKLSNFLRFDPTYRGRGLRAGNKLEEEVWATFATDRGRLTRVAAAIKANAAATPPGTPAETDADDDTDAEEGRVLTRAHRFRERNKALVDRKKRDAARAGGRLACETCGFVFGDRYGEVGVGFIECHHTRALSELRPGQRTRLEDLALLCSNCHRIVHRRRPWLTLQQLRVILQNER